MLNPMIQSLINYSEIEHDKHVLIDCKNETSLTAGELLAGVKKIALHLINSDLRKGDIIVITMPSGEDFCKIIYACFAIGCIPVLIDPAIKKSSLRKCIDELMPKLWIYDNSSSIYETTHSHDILESLKYNLLIDDSIFTEVMLDESCLILYTTGTTGLPKGVPWTTSQLMSHMHAQKNYYSDFSINTEFCFFSHLAIIAISIGRTAIIPHLEISQPSLLSIKSVIHQMKRFGCDYVFASPVFWKRFSEYCKDNTVSVDNIKVVTTAGAAVNVKVLNNLRKYIPNADIFIPYASTEVLMPISNISLTSLSHLTKNGTANAKGIPLGPSMPDMDVKIISLDNNSSNYSERNTLPVGQIGEIIVSGPRTTTEYFKRPTLTSKSKMLDINTGTLWHRMGDVGYIDSDQCIWFLSRLKYVRETPEGMLYPDKLEQFYNYHIEIPDSAIVYNDAINRMILIISSDYSDRVNLQKINDISKKHHLDTPEVMFYPGQLPTDSRHNSKINREELTDWITA